MFAGDDLAEKIADPTRMKQVAAFNSVVFAAPGTNDNSSSPISLIRPGSPTEITQVSGQAVPIASATSDRERPRRLTLNILGFLFVLERGPLYADDITVFVSHRLDITAEKKGIERYQQIAGVKIDFEKSDDLRLGAWMGWGRSRAETLLLE